MMQLTNGQQVSSLALLACLLASILVCVNPILAAITIGGHLIHRFGCTKVCEMVKHSFIDFLFIASAVTLCWSFFLSSVPLLLLADWPPLNGRKKHYFYGLVVANGDDSHFAN